MARSASQETLIGIDGCKGGWLCVAKHLRGFEAWISPDIEAAVKRGGVGSLIGIDIPIGFARSTARACDVAARALLRRRACTVFSAPVRAALAGTTYEEACRINREMRGRAISRQTFALYPKLREVDRFLLSHLDQHRSVKEVHPEVSFALWSGGPMPYGKQTPPGRGDRENVVEELWPGVLGKLRGDLGRRAYGTDDLLDAMAALWSTIRYANGSHQSLPEHPEFDERNLRMQIVG